jgi:hypothetical protein
MSISIPSGLLLASDLYTSLTSTTGQATSTTATAAVPTVSSTATSSAASSSTSSTNPLLQDMTSLLQALASGNVSGAQADITKIKADLKAQESSSTSSSGSSVKVTHGHHHHAAETSSSVSISTSSTDSTSDSASSSQSSSPLDSLLSQISGSLRSGSTEGALQDLAGFLVQNGQGTGNLLNTSA